MRERANKWQNLSVLFRALECDGLYFVSDVEMVARVDVNLTAARNKGKMLLFYIDFIQNVNQWLD